MNNYYDDELHHFGVKGMKWGVRRYQNPDGTLTAKGKKRYAKEEAKRIKKENKEIAKYQKQELKRLDTEAKRRRTSREDISKLSDQELRERIMRLQMEQQYYNLTKAEKTRGQRYIESMENALVNQVTNAVAREIVTASTNTIKRKASTRNP